MLDITTGVLQGLIFCPLLFKIYVNDSKLFYSIIYADDTKLTGVLSSFKINSSADGNMNNELDKISLRLKCRYMLISYHSMYGHRIMVLKMVYEIY